MVSLTFQKTHQRSSHPLDVGCPEAAVGPQKTLEQVAFLVDHVLGILPVGEPAACLSALHLTPKAQALCEDALRLFPVIHEHGALRDIPTEGIPCPLPTRLPTFIGQMKRCPVHVGGDAYADLVPGEAPRSTAVGGGDDLCQYFGRQIVKLSATSP